MTLIRLIEIANSYVDHLDEINQIHAVMETDEAKEIRRLMAGFELRETVYEKRDPRIWPSEWAIVPFKS